MAIVNGIALESNKNFRVDGYEMTSQLRAAKSELPILMVTAKQLAGWDTRR